jgi:hypothetical protein
LYVKLPRETLLSRADVETRATHNGAVLVDVGTGKCFRLNRVAADIWSMLETPTSFAAICAQMTGRYRVPASQIERDIGDLIRQLAGQDLVTFSVPGPSTS